MSAKPTEILMKEHRVIEKVLAAMTRYAEILTAGGAVERERLEGLVPFMRDFADACHHGKEEHRLFPLLVERGLPTSNGPVQVMCAEHDVGRGLVGELDVAIERYLAKPESGIELANAFGALTDFYARHIWKEDNVLFPMADQVLGEVDTAALLAAFDEVAVPDQTHLLSTLP